MSDPAAVAKDVEHVRRALEYRGASKEAKAAFARLLALLKEHGTSETSEAPEAPVVEVSTDGR